MLSKSNQKKKKKKRKERKKVESRTIIINMVNIAHTIRGESRNVAAAFTRQEKSRT